MHLGTKLLGLVACLTLASASAASDLVTFSGSGTVSSTAGKLSPTGLVPNGSPFHFSFSFDPAAASLDQADDEYAVYDLPVSNFSATLGSFAFPLSNDPNLISFVELYRTFSFFDGNNFSEPSIAFTFFLLGDPTTAAITPFAGGAGSSQQLAIGGVFRVAEEDPLLTVANLLGRGAALYPEFQYGTRNPTTRQSGVLNGAYAGGFVLAAAAVPEPGTWALMLLGFAVTGAALRRRQPARATAIMR